ncbi:MAG: cryptochrome/photolyase family protein [Solirubrobacteraceae bacterium]|nr:cryptochrome/photolyase family protein [Solirubrobacteraceae bacterium]
MSTPVSHPDSPTTRSPAMGHTALILGDQLMRDNPALEGADRVVVVESLGRLGRRRLHRRRAHLVLTGMRCLVRDLRADGIEVDYRREAASIPSVVRELTAGGERVVCANPNDPGGRAHLRDAGAELWDSNQFLVSSDAFSAWAEGRNTLRMEDFYRDQRRLHGVLLDDGEPAGGRWNFDQDNRQPPKAGLSAPAPYQPREDEIDEEVRHDLDRWVADGTIDLWGEDGPRQFAVTPDEAQRALDSFIDTRLEWFGPWQDAMVDGERTLYHSLLSVPLNLGVLAPMRVVRAAEHAYRDGNVPIQSAEGFIRQVLGWREYVHGVAHLRRRDWPSRNALGATAPLPEAFWGRESGWACLDTTIESVSATGYAHHIERLMVLGNIMLLAGVEPWAAIRWFQTAFVDGAEWVMAPNAAGMALYADGGGMTTKPYAAGGNYMKRMSEHCGGCQYDPRKRTGDDACPLTALYWDFLDRNRDALKGNHRVAMPLRSLAKIEPDELKAIKARARRALEHELGGRA